MNLDEIRQCCIVPKQHIDNQTLRAKYIMRPLSVYTTWLCLKLNYSANTVTALNLSIRILGCFFITSERYWLIITGTLLLFFGELLDYTDGNIALATKTVTKYGKYFDRIVDDFIDILVPIAIGIGIHQITLGFTLAVLVAFSSLASTEIEAVFATTTGKLHKPSLIKFVGTNLQSIATILLIPFAIFHGLYIYLVFYIVLTLCEASMIVYERLASKEREPI